MDKNKPPVFIFIHGFGTTNDDLKPLMRSFRKKNLCILSLSLKGSDNTSSEYFYDDWLEQINQAVERFKKTHSIYFVGFSFGGTIAIDFASRSNDIVGILSISTFFGHTQSKKVSRFLKLTKFLKIPRIKRGKLNTTTRETRNELKGSEFIDTISASLILKKASEVKNKLSNTNCPVLFIHSIDDRVASYKTLAQTAVSGGIDYRVITVRELNHFIQFDIPSAYLRDLALVYFSLIDDPLDREEQIHFFEEYYASMKNVELNWANTTFKLIVGFFSIFGFLVFSSYETVIQQTDLAPYFLLAYSLIILIYILLISIYFFYMNRVASYIKHHLEPLIPCVTLIAYKNNEHFSGRFSKSVTFNSAMVNIALPFLASLSIMIYLPLSYRNCFVPVTFSNFLMYIPYFFTLLLFFFDSKLLYGVVKHSTKELYTVVKPLSTTLIFEEYLTQLLSGIRPGCVKQENKG